MTIRKIPILTALIMAIVTSCLDACRSAQAGENDRNPAIVLTAFGTSHAEARKVFEFIDQAARKRYPEHDLYWAFTSSFIRKKLKSQGIKTLSLEEVVEQLRKDGHKSAVLQSLHVAPGQEFREIVAVDTTGLKVAVGKALLANDKDIDTVIQALGKDICPGLPNVVVCHGNNKHPEFNQQLVAFAKRVESRYDNVFVCSVEGQPGPARLQDAKRMAATKGAVHFVPLMVVAGDHIVNDVMGDEEESWKSIVNARKSTCGKPLGYRTGVLDVYFKHLDEALARLQK